MDPQVPLQDQIILVDLGEGTSLPTQGVDPNLNPIITSITPVTPAGDPPEVHQVTPQESTHPTEYTLASEYALASTPPQTQTNVLLLKDQSTQTDLSGAVIEVPEVHLDALLDAEVSSSTEDSTQPQPEPIDLPLGDIFTHFHLK